MVIRVRMGDVIEMVAYVGQFREVKVEVLSVDAVMYSGEEAENALAEHHFELNLELTLSV